MRSPSQRSRNTDAAACETILIVDDEPAILTVMSRLLQPHYCVRVATSGARALVVASTSPRPNLILLDVTMRGIDGYETLRRLRRSELTADIPVVFVTGNDSQRDEELGFALGAVDYITKPIRPAILLARVKTHLLLRRAREVLADQNLALEQEVARQMAEARTIQTVSIRALAHLAEIRDPETGDHILRTQAYVSELATALADHPRFATTLTPEFVKLVAKSAPLHDIGKVGIPDHILLKPGKLTPEEWAIMQTHAALGAQAIELAERDVEQPVAFLRLAKEIARSHHERWNGHGYPDGLSGEAIPISARLMALADVFDALTTARVYKAAMSEAKAKAIILSERGEHFDPAVVDAFEARYDRFVAIARGQRGESA